MFNASKELPYCPVRSHSGGNLSKLKAMLEKVREVTFQAVKQDIEHLEALLQPKTASIDKLSEAVHIASMDQSSPMIGPFTACTVGRLMTKTALDVFKARETEMEGANALTACEEAVKDLAELDSSSDLDGLGPKILELRQMFRSKELSDLQDDLSWT